MLVRAPATWQAVAQEGWQLLPAYLLNLAVLFFVGGPLGEETGWRGFALPRLQQRYGALAASLVLGVDWALWHLPNYFIPAMNTWTGNLWIYLGIAVALSVIHTWVYNGTGSSLLLVTLLHAAVDASTRLFLPMIFGNDRAAGNWVPLIAFGVWTLLLLLFTQSRLASAASINRERSR
jgi:membrane protease YdiL (CAAX protease family)